MAFAGSAPAGKAAAVTTSHGTSGATDISARRRYYRGGGGGAGSGAPYGGKARGEDNFKDLTAPLPNAMAQAKTENRPFVVSDDGLE